MALINYSRTTFLNDLSVLQFTRPNRIVIEMNANFNDKTIFFGGRQWSDFQQNINHVLPQNRAYFCLCLFTLVSADQNIHAHFPNLIKAWDRRFSYPKFGWCGFGAHFEKVRYLLQIPEQNGIDFNIITEQELQDYFCFHYQTGKTELDQNINSFFRIMLEDADFDFNSDIFSKLKEIMIDSLDDRKCM